MPLEYSHARACDFQKTLLIKHCLILIEKEMIPFKYDSSMSLVISQDFIKNYFLY